MKHSAPQQHRYRVPDAGALELGGEPRSASVLTVTNGLAGTLGAFVHFYDELTDALVQLNTYLDSKGGTDDPVPD